MRVEVLHECGYELALRGMAYSYKDRMLNPNGWWPQQKAKAERRAKILAHRDGGHNKFLESIMLWIDVEACRAWWSEFDTYRVGVTKQSESTMHTLSKRGPMCSDFEDGTSYKAIKDFWDIWVEYKDNINILKMHLPEGFLQLRLVVMNYKTLRNILWQREGHRLKWWSVFREEILRQVEHPEFLAEEGNHE